MGFTAMGLPATVAQRAKRVLHARASWIILPDPTAVVLCTLTRRRRTVEEMSQDHALIEKAAQKDQEVRLWVCGLVIRHRRVSCLQLWVAVLVCNTHRRQVPACFIDMLHFKGDIKQ